MKNMELKWESNNRAKHLASMGKIKYEDIIPKTQTSNFPFETATVRLAKVNEKYPFVTVHIRGKESNNGLYSYGPTCRVNFGGSWQGKTNDFMDSNGQLEEGLTWLDVHNVVEKVKAAMQLN